MFPPRTSSRGLDGLRAGAGALARVESSTCPLVPRVPTAPPALGHHWQVGGLRSQLSKQDLKVLDVKSTLGWRGGQVGILAFWKGSDTVSEDC